MSKVEQIEVVALRKGLKNGRIYERGDKFKVDSGSSSKWYKPTGEVKETASAADLNQDGKLGKAEILKWFEENQIEVDASLGVVKLREAYDEARASVKNQENTNDQ